MMGFLPHTSDSLFNIFYSDGLGEIKYILVQILQLKKEKKSEILILWLHVVTSHVRVHVQYNNVYEFM